MATSSESTGGAAGRLDHRRTCVYCVAFGGLSQIFGGFP
ncbi:hypothetical protein LINPERPRIM_LOCUS11639 [Linum perenne]